MYVFKCFSRIFELKNLNRNYWINNKKNKSNPMLLGYPNLQSLLRLITPATPRRRNLYYLHLKMWQLRLRKIIYLHQVNQPIESKRYLILSQQVRIYLGLNLKNSYSVPFPKSNQSPNLLIFSSISIAFSSGFHPIGVVVVAGLGEGGESPEVLSIKEEDWTTTQTGKWWQRDLFSSCIYITSTLLWWCVSLGRCRIEKLTTSNVLWHFPPAVPSNLLHVALGITFLMEFQLHLFLA